MLSTLRPEVARPHILAHTYEPESDLYRKRKLVGFIGTGKNATLGRVLIVR